MKNSKKITCFILAALLCASLFPATGARAAGFELGNTDLNILNGGVMLSAGEELYFNNGGIFVQRADDSVAALSADDGRNLNLHNGTLYYTLGREVRAVPADGGRAQSVFYAADNIKQMYLVNGEFYYLAGGKVYTRVGGKTEMLSGLSDILGFIPTAYGVIYLTGSVRDYELWAGDRRLLSGVSSCYTDSGYLVISKDGSDYMARLSGLFDGLSAGELEDFDLHGTASVSALSEELADLNPSTDNENYELMCDFDALLYEAGLAPATARYSAYEGESVQAELQSAELSAGVQNIVKRARQLTGFKWTPIENIYKWGGSSYFTADTEYTGVPYGQPVNTNGYIGYGISLDGFANALLDNSTKLYTGYSTYSKTAPYYSTDCSGFVSYCWGLTTRKTTVTIPNVAEKVGDQSIYSIQVGDCLDRTISHVVLITGLKYDADGNIVWIEVSEQTSPLAVVTCYGEGESRSLASFQSYYFGRGFEIYRNPNRDNVSYTPSECVQLEGEVATVAAAPKANTTADFGKKTVVLSTSIADAVIYYTLDGSAPSASSNKYTGALTFTSETQLNTLAVSPSFSSSKTLKYRVKIPQAAAPKIALASGVYEGNLVSSGSTAKLTAASGAVIHYTTDGSEPTGASPVYSSPIKITSDMTIKAMAEAKGCTASSVSTQSYRIGRVFTIKASASAGGAISPSGNVSAFETVSKTFTITPNAGYTVKDVLVDGASVGAVTSYTFPNVSAEHTISASFAVDIPFKDVATGAWYYDAVCFAYTKNLFKGMSETEFGPDYTMTRGMFITALGRLAGLSEKLSGTVGIVTATGVNIRESATTDSAVAGFVSNKHTVLNVLGQEGDWYKVQYGTATGYIRNDLIKVYSGEYTDLNTEQYYSVYVQWARISGVANGLGETEFKADEPISREDMCLIMHNYAAAYGKTLPKTEAKSVFTDDASISAGTKTAVYDLQQANIINGMGDGTFAPTGTARRSEVAQIYKNFVSAIG